MPELQAKQVKRNTAKNTARGKPFVSGHDSRRGIGLKGIAGRKPDEFKAMCQALASSDEVEKAVITILKNPKHPHFVNALKWASDHGYGKPKESVEVTGKDGGPINQVWTFGSKQVAF